MKPGRIVGIRVADRSAISERKNYAVTVEVGGGKDTQLVGFFIIARDELDAYRGMVHKARREGIELTMLGDEDENQDK